MDALKRDFPENHPSVLLSSSGPVCKPNQQSTSSVCISVSRPRCNGCIPLQLESVEGWIFPPVVLIAGILNKVKADEATAFTLAPRWKRQPWFPTILEMLVEYPRRLPQQPRLISLPFNIGKEHPLPAQTTLDREAVIKESLRTNGLSQAATDILLSSWSEARQKRCSRRTWACWCAKRGLCPPTAHVNEVLNFPSAFFSQNHLSYRAVAVYKCTISLILYNL